MYKGAIFSILILTLICLPNVDYAQENNRFLNASPNMSYLQRLPDDTLLVVVREDSSTKTVGALIGLSKKMGPGGIRLAVGEGDGPMAKRFFQEIGAPIGIMIFANASAATTATLGGHTDAGILPKNVVMNHVEAGRARVLAAMP